MGHAASRFTVLLVEDETLIRHLVSDWLSERGFSVHATARGDEALQYIGDAGDVHVLFTDVNLPGGMDGAELAQRARQMLPDLPIVYASGRYGPCDINSAVPHSVFVPKPYDPAAVCTLLKWLTAV
jgi:CheY-like chemotaxis protein